MELKALVERWLSSAGRDVSGRREALEWFAAYGTDYERAWRECRRGDHLILMCAALGGDAGPIFEVACSLARDAAERVPWVVPWPRTAVERAAGWQAQAPVIDPEDTHAADQLLELSMTVVRTARERRAPPTPSPTLRAEVRALLRQSHGSTTTAEGLVRACAAVMRALRVEPAFVERIERYVTRCESVALARATSAAHACLTGASSARPADEATGASAPPGGRSLRASVVRARARFERTLLFVEAYQAAVHAVEACSLFEASGPVAIDEASFAYATAFVTDVASGLARSSPPEPDSGPHHDALHATFLAARRRRLEQLADTVRARVAFASLKRASRPPEPTPTSHENELRETVAVAVHLARRTSTEAIARQLDEVLGFVEASPASSRSLLPIVASVRARADAAASPELVLALDRIVELLAERLVRESRRATPDEPRWKS